jgi:NifB/MoaA-like Fe-S oxidoreductase
VRVALVGNPKGARIMEDLKRLERVGIDYNTQVVLCPGINDGVELDRTIAELVDSGPRLNSIAVVPVGLSKFGLERQSRRVRLSRTCMRTLPGATIDIRRFEPSEAELVIEQIERWQAQFRRERGRTFVYLGDEFYLMTGRPVPAGKFYDGFPQVEDGIGITRLFLDDAARLLKRTAPGSGRGRSGTIACGTLISDTMNRLVDQINAHTGADLRVATVENKLFGSEINVSGLLTGGDVCDVLEQEAFTDPVFVSENMVSKRTKTFLDDMHVEQMRERLSRPVSAAAYLSQVFERLDPASPAM